MNSSSRHLFRSAVLALCLLLSACPVQLAPDYDPAIYNGITGVNLAAMEFFASASGGTDAASYADREGTYNKLIGTLDALQIQSSARPVPKNKITDQVNDWLTKKGLPPVDDDHIPSAMALAGISKTLTVMRNTDKKQGLTEMEVAAFKGQTVIYMDQAITYESFLQR
jgi:hypothetical protein